MQEMKMSMYYCGERSEPEEYFTCKQNNWACS